MITTMTTSSEITVPKKSDIEIGYAERARKAIKQAMESMGLTSGTLFVLLYGRPPEGNEEQTLRNRLNRGNPGSDFIGLCVSKMPPLQTMAMADFYDLTAPEESTSP